MMRRRDFIDPLGTRLPALEANEHRRRALQFVLALFYAEDIKRHVLDLIQTTDSAHRRLGGAMVDRVPKGTKNSVDKALSALVTDKAITQDEKIEMVGLIDYRNDIGHQVHNLLADVGTMRAIRSYVDDAKGPKYRRDAVDRLKYYGERLDGLYRTHHYIRTMNADRLLFASAEKALSAEIERLGRRIRNLAAKRTVRVKEVNAELSLKGTSVAKDLDRYIARIRYEQGRLTSIGAEICYRLFDAGKSPMTVAHILGISLRAATKRPHSWSDLGGKKRSHVDLTTLPRPIIRRGYN
jgi:hypothetical protein